MAVMALMFTANAFAANFFKIPSAGAETVLRSMPTDYVYNPDWKAGINTVGDAGENIASLAAADDTQAERQETEADAEEAASESDDTAGDAADAAESETEEASETADTAAQESAAATTPVATNNRVVCIDPGHQSKGNNAQEPIGPGATQTKAKVAGGTTGVATGVPEYQLTLSVALKLQSELTARGYTVIMCRTSNDVNISNAERAEIANNAGAGAFLRLHGNGAGSSDVSGAETLAPSTSNPYCSGIATQSQALSKAVLNGLCAATGAKNRGVKIADNMSGINWSRVPVTIVEMGYMTNPTEDVNMQDAAYQTKLAKGMVDGVDAFFGL